VPRADIHRVRLSAEDLTTCRGFPVTSIARTLVDLARCLPLETGSRIMADALRASRVSVHDLEGRIGWLAGCSGIERARRALAGADPKFESVLERELFALLRRAGLNPVAQFVVTAGGQFVARVDFALPGFRLAIEADGYETHARHLGFERDREKAALLQLAGWSLLSFTATQIRQRPDWVVATVLNESGSSPRPPIGPAGEICATSSPPGWRSRTDFGAGPGGGAGVGRRRWRAYGSVATSSATARRGPVKNGVSRRVCTRACAPRR